MRKGKTVRDVIEQAEQIGAGYVLGPAEPTPRNPVPLAQPQPETAAEIRAALVRQDEAKRKLVEAVGGDAELVAAAGEYLDATDALYRSQLGVPRVFG